MHFGVQELLIILVIVLVVFGATKVPQLMRGLGQGIKEFKQAVDDGGDKDDEPAGGKPSAEQLKEKDLED